MKRSFHMILVALVLILALGSIAGSVAAKEQGPFAEFRLVAGDPAAEPEFGRSVAIGGNLVAVGASGDGSIGEVYLYRRQGMVYVPEARLDFPEELPEACFGPYPFGNCSEFGRSVTIEGNKVLVGARFAPSGDLAGVGAVYVFGKHGDVWEPEQKIVSPAPENQDNFGRAVAIQGNLMVVTARKSEAEEGSVYLYIKEGTRWVYASELIAGDTDENDYFGQSVALQGDMIAVGARNAGAKEAGALYIFRHSGNEWQKIAKMEPSGGKKNDHFGFTVAISGDTIAVGARRADPDGLQDAGAAYVYTVEGDSVELVTKLTASDASELDEFGQSIAIAGDIIAVGAWKDNDRKGSIYLFRQIDGEWVEVDKITASDAAKKDEFGYSLAAFGNRMVTGAHKADDGAGAAYVLPVKM